MAPGKLLLHVGFGFASGALATVVMGTHQSRGTPMEWWQVMGDHKRVEVRNVHEVRYYRAPAFKAADPAATLDPAQDALVWEPNQTAAANEDHKGYHALLAAFLARGARRALRRAGHRGRRAGDARAGGDGALDGERTRGDAVTP